MSGGRVFCAIAAGTQCASVVCEDALTLAFIDRRQFNARIARAVAAAFPNKGLSLWHSIGEAADQEVPHLHFHVHPRLPNDGLLRVYPSAAAVPDEATRNRYAVALRAQLD